MPRQCPSSPEVVPCLEDSSLETEDNKRKFSAPLAADAALLGGGQRPSAQSVAL